MMRVVDADVGARAVADRAVVRVVVLVAEREVALVAAVAVAGDTIANTVLQF